MARVLFSLLGRPPSRKDVAPSDRRYTPARYDFGDGDHPAGAVFVNALLEHLRRAGRLPDRVVVFGTCQSIWGALLEPFDEATLDLGVRLAAHEDDPERPRPDALRRELDALQSLLSARLGVAVRCERVERLDEVADQRAFLTQARALLAPGDDVLIDVTHGFGHQRILLAQTLVALETLLGTRVEALYSGAYEIRHPATGAARVVRLDGMLQSVRLDRAVAQAAATGDPSALLVPLADADPLRKPLQRLADAWRLNQPDRIRSAATQVLGTLGNLSPAAQAELTALRTHLDEVIARHRGSIATQQLAAARSALARGDLLRASLALREACLTVGCVATGHAPDDLAAREGEARLWVDAQRVEFDHEASRDNAWRTLLTARNALAHAGAPTTRAVQRTFDLGPAAVTSLLAAVLAAFDGELRALCPAAFEAP